MLHYTSICKHCQSWIDITQSIMLSGGTYPAVAYCKECRKPFRLSIIVHYTAILVAMIIAMHAMQLTTKATDYLFSASEDLFAFVFTFVLTWSVFIAVLLAANLGVKYFFYSLYCRFRK